MEKVLNREEIATEDKWRIEDLYATDALWEKAYQKAKEEIEAFAEIQKTMDQGAGQLLTALQAKFALEEKLEKIYVYANQKSHEDTGNQKYQDLSGRAQVLLVQAENALSGVEPCLIALGEETIERYLQEETGLLLYKRYLDEIFRSREHVLTAQMEQVLAQVSEIAQGPSNIFSMFNNADIDFGTIIGEDGKETPLSHGRYVAFLESSNRQVRKNAFDREYETYTKMKNTLAATFAANVQQKLFFSKIRKYDSSLEAALDGSHIPVMVYDSLIEAVHNHMDSMYEYVKIRKEMLGLEELHMYDLYVPLATEQNKKYTFAEAKEIVKAGLAPLGEEYQRLLQKGYDEKWIDVYENKGKRSGAYSWGAYGTHPYVLLNYNGSLNHVFTLAHEMGHALHSYHSDAAQPYPYAGYRIFVAEVASTCNEALLIQYLLKNAENEEEKKYLVNYFLDQFKGTLYRQTMFAEFEQMVHGKVQKGETLTADALCEIYYKLNQRYYGADVVVDEAIAMEWARIPHFYTPFYVYQYATGFSAAIAISTKILKGEDGIVEKYKKFLSGGSSMDCIDLLKLCGVDMTTTEPVESALQVFEDYVQILKEYL